MYPPLFATCFASTAVKTALGTSPMRLYPFGEAPQDVALPYAVFQTTFGSPENLLGDVPDTDDWTVQVDVYAADADTARSTALALRNAIEAAAYIASWDGESRDPVTRNFRYGFTVDWIHPR